MPKAIDLTGKRFGNLTAVRLSEHRLSSSGVSKRYWLCKCDCGNTKSIYARSLTSGNTKSCGCLNIYKLKTDKRRKTHGLSKTHLYKVWVDIKRRCNNKSREDYRYYGGEGKRVCEEWTENYEAFYQWALSSGYKDGLTIDRIDNTKGYSPDNCRWVDMTVQANNRRSNHLLTYKGETKSLADWAREYSLNYGALNDRINKFHWSIEKALLTPVRKKGD